MKPVFKREFNLQHLSKPIGQFLNYISVLIMSHQCDCCSTCQYQLNTLRNKYQYMLLDYPKLRQKMIIANQAQQMYKQENMHLNNCRIQQESKIVFLEKQLQRYLSKQGRQNIEGRREISQIDQLNKTINSKNLSGKILKEDLQRSQAELSRLNQENEMIRRQNQQLNRCIKTMSSQIAFLQRNQRSQKLQTSNRLEDTKASKGLSLKTQGNVSSSSQHKLSPYLMLKNNRRQNQYSKIKCQEDQIQARIRQLQMENSRLRSKLISKV